MNSPCKIVKSPCNRNCNVEYPSKICIGCKRHINEIVGWTVFTEEEKQKVLDRIKESSN